MAYSKVIVGLLLLFLITMSAGARLPGGIGEELPATDDVISIANQVREDAKAQAIGENFVSYTPVSYATQVVAGVNYFIKVDIGNDRFIIDRIYKSLRGEVKLVNVKTGVSKDDPITYIQKE